MKMPDEKWPSSPVISRPVFTFNGIENQLFSENVLSIMVVEEEAGVQHCEVAVTNWGSLEGGGVGYFFESETFGVGKPIAALYQNNTFFNGFISGLTGNFFKNNPPVLIIEAKSLSSATPKVRKNWVEDYPGLFHEITISLETQTNKSKELIKFKNTRLHGHGTAEPNTMLHPEDHIMIKNLGSKFTGDYAVLKVTHLYDLQQGFRTEFLIERSVSLRSI
jgi:hypothetical protein